MEKKKVTIDEDKNVIWMTHLDMPPLSLRIPPSATPATPRGCALKKAVLSAAEPELQVGNDEIEGNDARYDDEKCDDEKTCCQNDVDNEDMVNGVDENGGDDDEIGVGIGGNDAGCDDEESCNLNEVDGVDEGDDEDEVDGVDEDGGDDDGTGDEIGVDDAGCDDVEDYEGGDKMGGDEIRQHFYDPKHDHVAKHLLKKVKPYKDRGALGCTQHTQQMYDWDLQYERKEVRKLVENSVMYKLKEASYDTVSRVILSAFVERWHPETNSFHMPFGEMTITLDDVHHMFGIPVVGKPMRINKNGDKKYLSGLLKNSRRRR